MQLLEKDPAQRIQSAHELARRLRAQRDIPEWCPDRAAQWWKTNLPSLPATTPAAAAMPAERPLAVGSRLDL